MIKKISILAIFLLCFSFVLAAAPFQSFGDLNIDYNKFDVKKQNEAFNFTFHVSNSTNLINDADCYFDLKYQDGSAINKVSNLPSISENEYYVFSNATNFSQTGDYSVVVSCNTSLQAGGISFGFLVNPSGESATTSTAFFYIGLLALLIIFLVLIIAYGFDTDNIVGKTFSIGFGYLILMGIVFVSWQMALSFIINSPFLVSFLRLSFVVLISGFFPLLIILFVYGVYMMIQIKEIRDMQKRGISIDEATERKYGRY